MADDVERPTMTRNVLVPVTLVVIWGGKGPVDILKFLFLFFLFFFFMINKGETETGDGTWVVSAGFSPPAHPRGP